MDSSSDTVGPSTSSMGERYELELLLRRSQGDRFVEPSRMLGEEIDAWLRRWKATRIQSLRTLEFYERSAKVWGRMRSVPVSPARRAPVEDLVAERAVENPRSAQNELAFLKRVLRDARSRGQKIDEAVLAIDRVKAPPRRGRALTVEQLYEFASRFPEHSKRLILLADMVEARQRVWFEMTDELLDLQNGIFEIPPELSRNGRSPAMPTPNAANTLPAPGADSKSPNPVGPTSSRSPADIGRSC